MAFENTASISTCSLGSVGSLDFLTQLNDCHGVVAAPVVACDHVKILTPQNIGVRGVAVFQGHQGQGTTVSAHCRAQLKTQLCEPFGAETGQNIGGEQSLSMARREGMQRRVRR